jgi:hypothetical protein
MGRRRNSIANSDSRRVDTLRETRSARRWGRALLVSRLENLPLLGRLDLVLRTGPGWLADDLQRLAEAEAQAAGGS